MDIQYRIDERLTYEEYVDFLCRSDLGSQYPRLRFEQQVRRVLEHVDLCITARHQGQLVGISFGLTDYAYWLFFTDLGVDRAFERQGIGSRLLRMTWEQAGGPEEIFAFTMSHPKALEFYEKCGLPPAERNCRCPARTLGRLRRAGIDRSPGGVKRLLKKTSKGTKDTKKGKPFVSFVVLMKHDRTIRPDEESQLFPAREFAILPASADALE